MLSVSSRILSDNILQQGWGMTETTCSAMGWDPNMHSDSFGVGELLPNCEARVIDEDGETDVKQGERGELWVRGPNIMKGYWRNEKATRETLTPDRWLKTGDVCYKDETGTYFIVDRKKELIKVKGLQVAPAELEAVLLENPAIVDASVVGVTIKGEELPRGYIVLKEGQKVSGEEVAKFLETRVSRHKRLLGGVVVVDAIPKNPVSTNINSTSSPLFLLTLLSLGKSCARSCEKWPKKKLETRIPNPPDYRYRSEVFWIHKNFEKINFMHSPNLFSTQHYYDIVTRIRRRGIYGKHVNTSLYSTSFL